MTGWAVALALVCVLPSAVAYLVTVFVLGRLARGGLEQDDRDQS